MSEVATIRPYVAPFYEDRVWNLDEFEDWEKELLTAVKLGAVHALEDHLAKLEDPESESGHLELWKPSEGRPRAWALDRWGDIVADSLELYPDGQFWIRPSTPLREMRRRRALRFKRFTQAETTPMLDRLAVEEDATLEDLRWAYLDADAALAASMADRGIHLDQPSERPRDARGRFVSEATTETNMWPLIGD
jgi:hypothetical protein